jgi:hypothetical protein
MPASAAGRVQGADVIGLAFLRGAPVEEYVANAITHPRRGGAVSFGHG